MTDNIVRLAISTCPNDTFAFAAILDGRVQSDAFKLDISLGDISELNAGLIEGAFDVGKASYAALVQVASEWQILPMGSALGFGNGPLLLTHGGSVDGDEVDGVKKAELRGDVLCPGELTTASLLTKRFYPGLRQRQVVFSDVMPGLIRGEVAFGVCIHEGRFTYQDQGLDCVDDLGEQWHREIGGPLPLGGLFVSNRVASETVSEVCRMIGDSLAIARQDPSSALPMMREYAQEFDDQVLMRHVDLYVNDETVALSEEGRRAISALGEVTFWRP